MQTINYAKENKTSGNQQKPKKGLKPCKVLYVYNLNETFNLEAVRNMFSSFEKIIEYKYSDEKKTSGLVFFESENAAIKILCMFKNVKIMNKTLKITFADLPEEKTDDYWKPFSYQEIEFDAKFSYGFSLQDIDE